MIYISSSSEKKLCNHSTIAPFEINVEIVDVFILFKNILQKKFKYHNDRNNKNLITDKEHKVIFNPPRTINKSEINKALSSINREMDEAAEDFYQTKKDDYYL